ncbi:MAG: electron transfer flavoprotein subunit alpha/FixB family protein [Candidatus Stahlbacteria bacterium]|nr:electron transfer flavoprotein subunit alpha/FixB family protein [Candidatus Stahlbacteria bacterium]
MVWIFGEFSRDKGARPLRLNPFHPVVSELLTKGRELADKLGEELGIVILGYGIDLTDFCLMVSDFGIDKIYLVDDIRLSDFNVEPYTSVITKIVLKYKPNIFIAGATSLSRTLFPRIAARLRTGLTTDCTALGVENGLLVQTRPAFGGNITATIICPYMKPQMATVRYKALKSPKSKIQSPKSKIQIIRESFTKIELNSRTQVIKFIEDVTQKINLDTADIIVAGGMGLHSRENFKILEELALIVGGAVASSRPPVDNGWISYSHQVGQTGKTVRPRVYIACGISGAMQHLAGMSSSEQIIVINNNPNAPIFKIADIGICGDLFEIVPKLIERWKWK